LPTEEEAVPGAVVDTTVAASVAVEVEVEEILDHRTKSTPIVEALTAIQLALHLPFRKRQTPHLSTSCCSESITLFKFIKDLRCSNSLKVA
jgi:hypothetical protein